MLNVVHSLFVFFAASVARAHDVPYPHVHAEEPSVGLFWLVLLALATAALVWRRRARRG